MNSVYIIKSLVFIAGSGLRQDSVFGTLQSHDDFDATTDDDWGREENAWKQKDLL